MADNPDAKEQLISSPHKQSNWGSKLFITTLILVLVFFWWLVIYDHGVKPIHGG